MKIAILFCLLCLYPAAADQASALFDDSAVREVRLLSNSVTLTVE